MDYQCGLFKICRKTARALRIACYDTPPRECFVEPAVYICRHGNLKGPILSMANFPMEVHPWVYSVFCDRHTCRKHLAEYTFSVRFGWNKWISQLVAWLVAPGFTHLIMSAGAIPTYRNSIKVRTTYRLSVDALKRGENILIFPDVNYTSQESDVGKLYEGFLLLDKIYFHETGKHVIFLPFNISDENRQLVLGDAVTFRDGEPYESEKERVLQILHDRLNMLMAENGI